MNRVELQKHLPPRWEVITVSSDHFHARETISGCLFRGIELPSLNFMLPRLPLYSWGRLFFRETGTVRGWAVDARGWSYMQKDAGSMSNVNQIELIQAAQSSEDKSVATLITLQIIEAAKIAAEKNNPPAVNGRMSPAVTKAEDDLVDDFSVLRTNTGRRSWGDFQKTADELQKIAAKSGVAVVTAVQDPSGGLKVGDTFPLTKEDSERAKRKVFANIDYSKLERKFTPANPDKLDPREYAKQFQFGYQPIQKSKDPLFIEEDLAQSEGDWVDQDEMAAAYKAGLGWMLRPFEYSDGAFAHPDLLKAIDEFDDINWDTKLDKYNVDKNGHAVFHMPLAEFLRRCRLNEKHKRAGP